MSMAKTIYVYENWSSETPIKLGMLYVDQGRGSEHYAFEYDETWLTTNRFACVFRIWHCTKDASIPSTRIPLVSLRIPLQTDGAGC